MAIVYQHRRLDTNEVFYIGIGKEESRAYSSYHRNNLWKNIVNKYGYEVDITHQDIIWEEACVIEKYLISFWGRKDLGKGNLVNMTDGGEGAINKIITEDSRQKMSDCKKGIKRKPLSEKHKQKISLSKKDIKRKPLSEETRQKISNGNKGKKMSNEAKQKMSISAKGKKLTEETKEKMSKSKKGIKRKSHSEETKQKISNTKKNKLLIKL